MQNTFVRHLNLTDFVRKLFKTHTLKRGKIRHAFANQRKKHSINNQKKKKIVQMIYQHTCEYFGQDAHRRDPNAILCNECISRTCSRTNRVAISYLRFVIKVFSILRQIKKWLCGCLLLRFECSYMCVAQLARYVI